MAFKSIEEAIENRASNLTVSILLEASHAASAAATEALGRHRLHLYGSIKKVALEEAAASVHVDAGVQGKQVLHGIIKDRLIKDILKGASVD